MKKQLATFNINGNDEPKKKKKKKVSLKQRLPILIVLLVVVVIISTIATFLILNMSDVDNDKIIANPDGVVISAAEIEHTGFTNSMASDNNAPTDIYNTSVGSTIYSYCLIGQFDDVATNVAVAWETPEGEIINSESLAVNRDGYYYSELDVEMEGDYTVIWTINSKNPVATQITSGPISSQTTDTEPSTETTGEESSAVAGETTETPSPDTQVTTETQNVE